MLSLQAVTKRFNQVVAVDKLSCEVPPGSIFGLLGPNGAGKTTTIRMIMNIIMPDEGQITFQGIPNDQHDYRTVGYLPEERGLYQKARLLETIVYFARLKGLTGQSAHQKALHYLKIFGIDNYAGRKIEELSKGNQQKVQFIIAIIHDPILLVLDEPFSGLDPVNQLLLKQIIAELQQKGTTIIFSTHQMEQVEKLCDRILLINRGKSILYGDLRQIKREYGAQHFQIEYVGDKNALADLDLAGLNVSDSKITGVLDNNYPLNDLLMAILARVKVTSFQLIEPSLEQIFIEQVQQRAINA
jgi:ABC-2 type transport system ATP-binding protein